jgi:ParB family chromosome partitioning protein
VVRKKSGLGRGLAELLGDKPLDENSQAQGIDEYQTGSPAPGLRGVAGEEREQRDAGAGTKSATTAVVDISCARIAPNPRQPRRSLDRDTLEELAKSIESVGIVQPVIVRRQGEGYELIAGERRWRAAQLAGFTVVPAIVRGASDTESLELALVENLVRQQLNPIDEACALQILLDDLGVTQERLAAQVGKSRPALANKLRLLELPAEIQQMLAEGDLAEGHGRALLGLGSRGLQLKLARKAAREGLSVRKVEAEVRRLNDRADDERKAGAPSLKPVITRSLAARAEAVFRGTFHTDARVSASASGIRVELKFKDVTELESVINRLSE